MRSLSDGEKLILIFFISLMFMVIILILFHFFRKYRKDKLISILKYLFLANKYNTNYLEDDEETDWKEREMSDFNNISSTLFINTREKLKNLKNLSKDYSFFGWMKFVYNTNDKQVFSLCNAEGFMYLYFLRTTGFFFFIISIFSVLVFIPLFSIKFFESNEFDVTTLQKLTIKNAYDNREKLWLVLFFSFLYTFMAYYHIYNYKKKLELIQKKVETEDSMDSDISMHTLHIRGLNKNLSYIEAKKIIQNFFDINFSGLIVEIQVIPNYDNLMSLIDRKFEIETKIDKYKNLNCVNKKSRAMESLTMCCGERVDGEIYYHHWKKIIDNMLKFYRKLNSKINTGNVFISFKNPMIIKEIMKNKKLIYGHSDTFNGQLLEIKNWSISQAPPPSDVIWENIKFTKKWRVLKMIIFTLILFIVCLVIITPNKIKEELDPLINEISEHVDDEVLKMFIKEYSYPLIVVIMNSGILPLAVYYISLYERHYKRSYREKSILVKSFAFMIINTMFIPTFGILSWSKIQIYIESFKNSEWDYDISKAFIDNCYFFMRYIVQVTFLSNSIQLLALPQFIVKKLRILIAQTDYEKFYASLIKKYFDYGFNYSFSITVFVLTLCFSTTIPLIAPFGCLFFYLKYFVDKYNLLFVYPVEFESHGNIGFIVLKFLLLGIFFYQFIISNLFLKLFAERSYAIWATLLYLLFSVIMYFVSKRVLITKQSKASFSSDSVFEEILDKTRQSFAFMPGKDNCRESVKNRLISNSKITQLKFFALMKESYVHPAEKNIINNPIQIWNDSYNFIKTMEANEVDKEKHLIEYEHIIKREEKRNSN